MEIIIRYNNGSAKIIDMLKFAGFDKNETLSDFKKRVLEHINTAFDCKEDILKKSKN